MKNRYYFALGLILILIGAITFFLTNPICHPLCPNCGRIDFWVGSWGHFSYFAGAIFIVLGFYKKESKREK